MVTSQLYTCNLFLCVTGVYQISEHIPAEEKAINTAYYTHNPDLLSNNPVKEPIRSYAEVIIPT